MLLNNKTVSLLSLLYFSRLLASTNPPSKSLSAERQLLVSVLKSGLPRHEDICLQLLQRAENQRHRCISLCVVINNILYARTNSSAVWMFKQHRSLLSKLGVMLRIWKTNNCLGVGFIWETVCFSSNLTVCSKSCRCNKTNAGTFVEYKCFLRAIL